MNRLEEFSPVIFYRGRNVKKIIKVIAAIFVLVPLLMYAWLLYSTKANLASPTQEALAALVGDDAVRVEAGDWLVMRPVASEPKAGLILYPGANCDIRGYASILRSVAAQGYLVIAVSMPFDFSIFSPNKADEVRAAYPEIRKWVIAGHSMGGAMAARFAFLNEANLAGLILWDAYPPAANSLADFKLPVVHVHRATLDGLAPQSFAEMRYLFPANSQWVPVPGGLHMYFGSFNGGAYQETWEAGIERDAQQALIVAATLDGMAQMTGP
jgi:hypothetical protein